MKRKPHKVARLSRELIAKRYRQKKGVFVLYLVLNLLVLASIVSAAIQARWESIFIGFLAMLLLLIPTGLEKSLRIVLPKGLEIVALLFVFAAQILGEMNHFYIHIPWWDDLLHTVNGFMFAAFGFALVDILNRASHKSFKLSPLFLAFVAFCFSMTIGVCWEFFEYLADTVFKFDMQKDTIITAVRSMELSDAANPEIIRLRNIEQTIILYGNGEQFIIEGGYLDIGLHDTILDLLVNFVGAFIFSIFGYIYVKGTGKRSTKIAEQFIPRSLEKDCPADADTESDTAEQKEEEKEESLV